ncbi:uncharacterized protein LOC129966663 isoform X2 [Argiope bruennichi]|uniref:uncharacterized protein LOC129966663 isoform X2 n=1 Tax=Argiope bruennichi TaxID=94029 RepID=UPI0024958D38|nr:uncharacterized protein LOC129966663 isoform X2 [Argiope bruennichi]
MADLAFISKSDLEILKALTLTNDINKKYNSNSVQTSNDMQTTISSENVSVNDNTDSQVTAFLSCASENFVSIYNSFKFDSEYETLCYDVKCVNIMCDLFIEKNRFLEICSFIKDVSPIAQEIISTNRLYKVLEEINNTTDHIVLICDKMYKIQQVLQEKPCERTLKVNPSCQKAVMKFFTIAKSIMEKLQQQVENIENYRSKNAAGIETYHKDLQSKLHGKILELAKRIDIISQFRDQILSTSTQNSVSTSKIDMLLS